MTKSSSRFAATVEGVFNRMRVKHHKMRVDLDRVPEFADDWAHSRIVPEFVQKNLVTYSTKWVLVLRRGALPIAYYVHGIMNEDDVRVPMTGHLKGFLSTGWVLKDEKDVPYISPTQRKNYELRKKWSSYQKDLDTVTVSSEVLDRLSQLLADAVVRDPNSADSPHVFALIDPRVESARLMKEIGVSFAAHHSTSSYSPAASYTQYGYTLNILDVDTQIWCRGTRYDRLRINRAGEAIVEDPLRANEYWGTTTGRISAGVLVGRSVGKSLMAAHQAQAASSLKGEIIYLDTELSEARMNARLSKLMKSVDDEASSSYLAALDSGYSNEQSKSQPEGDTPSGSDESSGSV